MGTYKHLIGSTSISLLMVGNDIAVFNKHNSNILRIIITSIS